MEGDLAQGCSRKDPSNKWFIEFEESTFNSSGMRWNDNLTVFPTWRMLDTAEVWHVSEHAEQHWRFFLIAARYIYISAVSYRFADVVPGQTKRWHPSCCLKLITTSYGHPDAPKFSPASYNMFAPGCMNFWWTRMWCTTFGGKDPKMIPAWNSTRWMPLGALASEEMELHQEFEVF